MSRKLFNYDQCSTKKMEKKLKQQKIFSDRNRTQNDRFQQESVDFVIATEHANMESSPQFFRSWMLSSAISIWNLTDTLKTKVFLARFYSLHLDAKTLKSLSQHVKLHSRFHNLPRNSSVPIQNPLHQTRKRRISASEIRNLGFYLESHQNPRNQIIRSRISLSLSAFRDAETLTGNIRSGSWKILEKNSDLSIFGELESNQKEIWDKNVQKIEIPSRFRRKRAGKMGLLPVAGKYREKGTSFFAFYCRGS